MSRKFLEVFVIGDLNYRSLVRYPDPDNPSDRKTRLKGFGVQMLEEIHGRKSQVLTTVDKDNWVLEYYAL